MLALCREEQPHAELFDLTISALRAIDSAGDADAPRLALGFEGMALTLLGFGPELTRCVVCSKPARNIRTTRLSPIHGGLLCSACRSEDPRASPLRAAGVTALRVVCAGPLVEATTALADPSVRADVKRALDAWTSALVDRRLP